MNAAILQLDRPDAVALPARAAMDAQATGRASALLAPERYTANGIQSTSAYCSGPLRTVFPFKCIRLAGYLPEPGLSLASDEPQCDERKVQPGACAREPWQDVAVQIPAANFRLVEFVSRLEAGLSVMTGAAVAGMRSASFGWPALACGVFVLLSCASRLDVPPARGRA